MVTIEQREKFKKLLLTFLREEGIARDDIEFNKLLRSWAVEFNTTKYYNFRSVLDENDKKDFSKLHEMFVLEMLNFIDSHPKIQELIEATRNTLSEEWNTGVDDEKLKIIPDIRCYFGADGMDESLKHRKWTPATDAYLSIEVGNQKIIESF